jgi:anti-anti-sigma factor
MTEEPVYVRFRQDPPVVVGDVEPDSMADVTRMEAFGNHVVSTVSKHKGLALLLNFEKVSYLSSAALTELIRIRETIRGNGGALRLSGLSPNIFKVFEITRLDGDFSVRPGESPQESIARFKQDIASSPAGQSAGRPAQG